MFDVVDYVLICLTFFLVWLCGYIMGLNRGRKNEK